MHEKCSKNSGQKKAKQPLHMIAISLLWLSVRTIHPLKPTSQKRRKRPPRKRRRKSRDQLVQRRRHGRSAHPKTRVQATSRVWVQDTVLFPRCMKLRRLDYRPTGTRRWYQRNPHRRSKRVVVAASLCDRRLSPLLPYFDSGALAFHSRYLESVRLLIYYCSTSFSACQGWWAVLQLLGSGSYWDFLLCGHSFNHSQPIAVSRGMVVPSILAVWLILPGPTHVLQRVGRSVPVL